VSKKDKPSGFKLKNDLERLLALVQAGKFEDALPIAERLAPELRTSDGYRIWLHCLEQLGRGEQLPKVVAQAVESFPEDAELAARLALSLYERDDYAGAAEKFRGIDPRALEQEPEILARYAHSLLATGKSDQALEPARRAYSHKSNGVPALILGLALLDAGDVEGAQEPLGRSAHSLDGPERAFAESVLGLAAFWHGDTERALELWQHLDDRAALAPRFLPYLAIAEANQGQSDAARAVLARAPGADEPSGLLALGRVELASGRPEAALEALARMKDPGDVGPELVAAARGRALRMLGRNDEAKAVLSPLLDSLQGAAGAMARVDLARIASDQGAHEEAAALFGKALALDARSSEAEQGLARARERMAWRESLEGDARSRIQAARDEAEAMRRAFAQREREIEMLRARLAQTEREATEAEQDAARARADADRARRDALREELAKREAEAADRAAETLREAFGDASDDCPAGLLEALRVAETTYQKALYTELHPAAVAVLFAGALERGLYLLLVRPFDQSLTPEERAKFLKGATRELRPGRTEYIERFVEAFDPERKAKAPSLGEISRALSRRKEAHLAAFDAFLGPGNDELYARLATFVERAKEQLRDPVAHGRALELPQGELNRFRQELLIDLGGTRRGALPALLDARRKR
jgi:tetratricopeptide (TPR) repeat protein